MFFCRNSNDVHFTNSRHSQTFYVSVWILNRTKMAETPYENENWPDLIDDEVKTHQKFEDCFKKRTVELTTEENIPYVPKIIRQLRTWYIKLCKETKDFDNEKRLLQEKVSEESDLNKNLKGQVENLTRKNQELNHEVKNKGNTQLTKNAHNIHFRCYYQGARRTTEEGSTQNT